MRIGSSFLLAGLLVLNGCARNEIGTIVFTVAEDSDPRDDLREQRGSQYWASEFEAVDFRDFVQKEFPDRVSTFVLAVDLEPTDRWSAIAILRDSIDAPPDGCQLIADALNRYYRKRQYSEYDTIVEDVHHRARATADPELKREIERRISEMHPREAIARWTIASVSSPK